MAISDDLHLHGGLAITPLWRTKRQVAGGVCVDVLYHDPRTTITSATVNVAGIEKIRVRDAIEWAAIDRENGFRHLRVDGVSHGLGPIWDGVAIHSLARAVR